MFAAISPRARVQGSRWTACNTWRQKKEAPLHDAINASDRRRTIEHWFDTHEAMRANTALVTPPDISEFFFHDVAELMGSQSDPVVFKQGFHKLVCHPTRDARDADDPP